MKSLSFYTALRSEHYKLKYNVAVWLIILFPLLTTIGTDLYVLSKTTDAINNPEITTDFNPWIYILGRYIFQFYSLLYPILVAILCYSLCDIEYKNKGFRLLFTRPLNKIVIFSSKIVFLLEILLISILLAYLIFLLSGFVLGKMLPGYGFFDYSVSQITLIYFLKLYIGISAISMVQYFLSLLFKSFVIPIGFACIITIFCMMSQNGEYVHFIPYNTGWQLFIGFANESIHFLKGDYINMVYIFFFLVLSYFVFERKK